MLKGFERKPTQEIHHLEAEGAPALRSTEPLHPERQGLPSPPRARSHS